MGGSISGGGGGSGGVKIYQTSLNQLGGLSGSGTHDILDLTGVVVAAGQHVLIKWTYSLVYAPTDAGVHNVIIRDGATTVYPVQGGSASAVVANSEGQMVGSGFCVDAPSAGTHDYKLQVSAAYAAPSGTYELDNIWIVCMVF